MVSRKEFQLINAVKNKRIKSLKKNRAKSLGLVRMSIYYNIFSDSDFMTCISWLCLLSNGMPKSGDFYSIFGFKNF